MENKSKYYKSLFLTYFDGCYEIPPTSNVSNTFQMGVCKLEYVKKDNELIVHLRRPGLLIGKQGKTINAIQKHLNINIKIVEVNLLNE